MRRFFTNPTVITSLLIFQVIPIMLLPPSSYSISTQEWWLPLMLAVLALISFFQIAVRRSTAAWPWYLISFANGFNIISRLMLFMPHLTTNINGVQVFNSMYFFMSMVSMLFSVLIIWMSDLPEVKTNYLKA